MRADARQDRIKFLERQLERQRARAEAQQAQLDDVHRMRIAATTRYRGEPCLRR
jgi:hypothetical protein